MANALLTRDKNISMPVLSLGHPAIEGLGLVEQLVSADIADRRDIRPVLVGKLLVPRKVALARTALHSLVEMFFGASHDVVIGHRISVRIKRDD
jgi:hypothetical protein